MPIPEPDNASAIILIFMGFIGLLCTLFTLALIHSMNRYNSYILLVASLTVAQLFYDISVILVLLPTSGYVIDVFIRVMSGIVSTLLTNVISIAVVYVMVMHKSIDIFKWYKFIIISLVLFGSLNAIPISVAIHTQNDTMLTKWSYLYQTTRFFSILLNFLLYIYIQTIILKRGYTAKKSSTYDPAGVTHVYADPVVLLSNRMKYYPVVQIITRVCVAFFELKYGYDYDYDRSSSTLYKASSVLYALTLPSAAFGYFIVFLSVTPGAWSHLINVLRKFFGWELDNTFETKKLNSLRTLSRVTSRSRAPSAALSENDLSHSFAYDDDDESFRESSFDKSESSYVSNRTNASYNLVYCDEDELSKAIVDLYNNDDGSKRAYSVSYSTQDRDKFKDVTSETFTENPIQHP